MFFTRSLKFLSADSVFQTEKRLSPLIKSLTTLGAIYPVAYIGVELFKFLCFKNSRCFCSRISDTTATNDVLPAVYVGAKVVVIQTLSQDIVELFAKATGDWNPVHFPAKESTETKSSGSFESENKGLKSANVRTPIVHGALLNGIVSGVIGTKLPGPGTLLVSQTLNYSAALPVGSQVEVEVEVIGCKRREVNVQYKVVSSDDRLVVMDGVARLMVPKGRVSKVS